MNHAALPLRPFICAVAMALTLSTPWLALAEESAPPTLERAIEIALSHRPEVKGFSRDIQAAEARADQTSMLPNPELELESSNLAEENTVGINQTYEFGSKRNARADAERSEIPLIENECARARLDIIEEVSQAFVALVGAQEKLALARESHETARKLADSVSERVAAGAISPIEETRAKVFLAGATTSLVRTKRELEEAKAALIASLGTQGFVIASAQGNIPQQPVVPEKAALLRAALNGPDLERWKLEREKRTALLESERADTSPDLTFSAKYAYNRETEESTGVFGVTIPIPFFNNKRGSVREAELQLDKIQFGARAEELRLASEIERRHTALIAIAEEVSLVRDGMISPSELAFAAVTEGYRQGKFRYLDVLDASTTLTEAKLNLLELLISFELEKTALDRLTAKALTGGKEN